MRRRRACRSGRKWYAHPTAQDMQLHSMQGSLQHCSLPKTQQPLTNAVPYTFAMMERRWSNTNVTGGNTVGVSYGSNQREFYDLHIGVGDYGPLCRPI